MTLQSETVIQQIYEINSFYAKQKVMGPYFKGWIKGALEKGKIEYLTDKNGDVIAFVVFSILKRKPFVTLQKLAVREDKRLNGFGSFLLKEIKQKALSMNYAMQTRVAKENIDSIRFYEKMGFTTDDDKKNDYSIRMTWNV